ncbi:MAG TPA: response regulator, partial [Tahibacter sp.]|nr:response regulator [Tahibacter sp.]
SGELPVAAPVVASAAPVVEPTPVAAAPVETPKVEEVAKAAIPPRPIRQPVVEEEDPAARAPQEMIRVRSDLLDSLVNYAGEVSIYRSRLEQQVTTFRFNLVEFEQTVSRLREQLRKLEMETEAQIIARYQREHHEPGQTVFDPLELDRFSQLQQLSRALGESVSDLVSIQNLLDDLTRQSETLLLQQSRVSSDLQEGLMRTRMVPFDSLVPSLRRTVRQAAQEIGKRAQLKVEGAQGEMDRNLLERMKAPFEHMLRNALAHGIEGPDDRQRVGKNPEGTVTIQVSREATEVVLRVLDDGRGMDRDAIRKKAIERGLLNADAQLSDRDLYAFILETGFSTAEQVTQLAGRGVGMDVVHNEIKQLGGALTIDSERGKGSVFTIRLPFTLAVTQAILVRLGEATYAIPMSSVQGVVRIGRDDLDRRLATANPIYTYAGEEFHIYELAQLLNVPVPRLSDEAQVPLLMTRTGDQRAAVRIDGVVGSREVVVKSVGPQISSVPGIFGATIMGDGSVVMILDLAPLVRRFVALRAASVEAGVDMQTLVPAPVAPPVETRRQPLVMVVDDSITMRKVTTRVLERNDMDVVTAKDGLDAVEKLQDKVPDLVLLDIEMPRMDGYELATYMKNDPRLKLVPIIMITSRTGEKHRQRALEIGVERYLGKPYQEVDLLRNVQETLRLSRA